MHANQNFSFPVGLLIIFHYPLLLIYSSYTRICIIKICIHFISTYMLCMSLDWKCSPPACSSYNWLKALSEEFWWIGQNWKRLSLDICTGLDYITILPPPSEFHTQHNTTISSSCCCSYKCYLLSCDIWQSVSYCINTTWTHNQAAAGFSVDRIRPKLWIKRLLLKRAEQK